MYHKGTCECDLRFTTLYAMDAVALKVAIELQLAGMHKGELQQVEILHCCLFMLEDFGVSNWCLYVMNSFLLAGALDPWDVQFHSNWGCFPFLSFTGNM